jgi:uncharacterized protein (TIGR03437 family)
MQIRYWTFLATAMILSAQPTRTYRISTVAGTAAVSDGVPATAAVLNFPSALAVGPDGVVYIGSTEGIQRIRLDGVLSKVPGAGQATSIAVDGGGTLHYLLGGPEYYRLPAGTETTITTRPTDGVIQPDRLTGVAVNSKGDVFIADQRVRRVLRIDSKGFLTVAAGIGSRIALTGGPTRIAVDSADRIYLTQLDGKIVRISGEQNIEVIAGNGLGSPIPGGAATASPFLSLGSVAVSPRGEVFFLDRGSIYKVTASGILETVLPDQSASDLAVDKKGNLLFLNSGEGKVWSVGEDGTRTLVAGMDRYADGVPAVSALLKSPAAVAVEPSGAFWIADTGNFRIRRVGQDGVIRTVAGNGVDGTAGDGGPGVAAQVIWPNLLARDQDGNLYISLTGGLQVRRLRPNGIIEAFAGTGQVGNSGDGGAATEATFQEIGGLAVDGAGNVFISDRGANRVRVVDRNGRIRNYAGTGQSATGGEGVPASTTPLYEPTLLAADSEGNLAVYETREGRLRRITRAGIISTWSSTPPLIAGGNSDAQWCATPAGLAFDADGSLLFTGGKSVCRLMPDGTTWLVAGGSRTGFAGDGGPALSAMLLGASGIAVDPNGAIFFADSGNHRIRKLERENPGGSVALVPRVNAVFGAGGSYSAPPEISPGGMSTVYGTDFASFRVAMAVSAADLVDGTLPTKLADTCVEIAGRRAFLTFVSSRQINFQTPDVPTNTSTTLQVIAGCGTANEIMSNAWTITTRAATPEFLYWIHDGSETKPIAAVNSVTGEFIGRPGLIPGLSFVPAKSGDFVTLYCISLARRFRRFRPALPLRNRRACRSIP